jgi:hypothetical protein
MAQSGCGTGFALKTVQGSFVVRDDLAHHFPRAGFGILNRCTSGLGTLLFYRTDKSVA